MWHHYQSETELLGAIFHTVEMKRKAVGNVVNEMMIFEEGRLSRVELFMVTSSDRDIGAEMLIARMLGYLNRLLIAYAVTTKDSDVHSIPLERLYGFVEVRTIEPVKWFDVSKPIVLVQLEKMFEKSPAEEAMLARVPDVYQVIRERLNPFIDSEAMWLDAKREFKLGYYRDAIVHCQTSMEMFLAALYSEIRKIEGADKKTIDLEFEDMSFMRMLKSQFHGKIGGRWSVDSVETESGRWYSVFYLLRNRVVHEGYAPTNEEVRNALEASIKFRSYVVLLVKSAKAPYSEMGKYFG